MLPQDVGALDENGLPLAGYMGRQGPVSQHEEYERDFVSDVTPPSDGCDPVS